VNIYLGTDRLDDALAEAKRTMEIDPDYVYFEPNLALVYRDQGRLQEALEIYQRLEQTRQRPSSGLVITYARLGRTDDARKALARLTSAAETGYVPGELIAAAYLSLGDKESAIQWLNRAVEEHSGAIHSIAFAPEFRALRGDRRFAEILRRIGLDPGQLPGRP
jgi:tetratricopeptide (TPR) repeat protein